MCLFQDFYLCFWTNYEFPSTYFVSVMNKVLKNKKSPEIKPAAKFHKVVILHAIALEIRIRTTIIFLFVKIIQDLYFSTVLT